jgi:hypothetical protein
MKCTECLLSVETTKAWPTDDDAIQDCTCVMTLALDILGEALEG